MAKLSKEELKAKIDTLSLTDEEKISMLEDIEDSMESEDTSAIDELQAKYDELKVKYDESLQKYKDRFLSGSEEPENKEESEETESEDETEDLKFEDLIDEKGDLK